jgi:hypothetical protein
MSSSPWTVPLKRNWKPGTFQVAGFLRAKEGRTVSMCHDEATEDEKCLVLWLVVGARRMSPELKERLRAEYDALVNAGKPA